jgi:phi LC3 family holin
MLNINLLKRFENKTFAISFIGALIVFLKLCKLDFIADLIPKNYADIITAGFGLLAMLGIVIDPTTTGISDQVVTSNSTENQIQADSDSTSSSSDNSASSKIVVDNPDNGIVLNKEVTVTTAIKPN